VRLLFWLLALPLLLVVVVFAVNNHQFADLDLWPVFGEPVAFPVYGVALIGLFAGFLIGGIIAWIQGGRSRSRVRRLVRQLESEQRQKTRLSQKVSELEAAKVTMTLPATTSHAA
jgi:uncharacterized integral membrane protein